MGNLKIGDIVARKSYGLDILFKVADITKKGGENIVTLKGISYRIQADSPESDLIVQSDQRVREQNMSLNRQIDRKLKDIIPPSRTRGNLKKMSFRDTSKETEQKFLRPGKVLHIDGDSEYLETCLNQYKQFGIDAVGKHVPEKDQPSAVYALLQEHRPDILVLTGHDGVLKGENSYTNINSYRNSKYFVEAVKEARRFASDVDSLVIFAGACQSMYNKIIETGANFASAPQRVLIHALDPVLICQKIAFAKIDSIVDPIDVIKNTITGAKGIGGFQTRGKYRDGYPMEPYST